jgi:formate hydrogenlyase subunit 6/NADH:ubiquinone oxidoreductase subunit I
VKQSTKWWYAQFNLCWRIFLHYLKKAWPWSMKAGLEKFKSNYVPEGLPMYSVSFRQIAHQPGLCTACGLCDAVCPVLHSNKSVPFLGPMRLVLGAMRGGPTVRYALADLSFWGTESCASCRECEKVCPEEISIIKLSDEFTKQWQQVSARCEK